MKLKLKYVEVIMDFFLNKMVNEWSVKSGKPLDEAIVDVAKYYDMDVHLVEANVRNAPMSSALTQSEIERELGVTRQNVSQILKRGLRKVYQYVKKVNSDFTDFEVACYISQMMNVDKSQNEMIKFFKLFPSDIKKLIKNAGIVQCTMRTRELIKDEEELSAMSEML